MAAEVAAELDVIALKVGEQAVEPLFSAGVGGDGGGDAEGVDVADLKFNSIYSKNP